MIYNQYEVVDFTDQLLTDALTKRASDIHFEPYQDSYRIRMRIDGVLQVVENLPIELAKQITTRLKILSKLNIAEQRLPQDGQLLTNGQAMRISTLPVINGEKIVLRVMDNQHQPLQIEQLGFTSIDLNTYLTMLNLPQGLILVTGPTGSGKTLTLYSGLHQVNQDDRNICSVEDPIEMPIKGVNQTQINPKAGLSFAQALRAFLRQDPDIMMIGEIRDQETAEIAVQAAQTGHLVLSTLHTNSAAEALVRLNQMGIQNYLIASSLKLVIAQRLVRKLCPHCKKSAPDPVILYQKQQPISYSHFIAQGCEQCIGGYSGRVDIYEFLVVTSSIQSLLLADHNCSLTELEQLTKAQKIPTLQQSALILIQQGVTSFNEIQRVLGFSLLSQTDINSESQ